MSYIIQKNGWYLVSNSTSGQTISNAVSAMVVPNATYNIDGNNAYYAPQPSTNTDDWIVISVAEEMQGSLGYWVLITDYNDPSYLTEDTPYSMRYIDTNTVDIFLNTTIMAPPNYNNSNLLMDTRDTQDDAGFTFSFEKVNQQSGNNIITYNEPVYIKIYNNYDKYGYYIAQMGQMETKIHDLFILIHMITLKNSLLQHIFFI